MLGDLIAGGAELAITARSASTMLRSIRPASVCERTSKDLAHDLVRDLRAVDASLADIERRMSDALDGHRSRLRQVDGVGSVTAMRLIGRTGPASRFPTSHAFATYAGVAPFEIASGERTRHRLSRAGIELNSAIHLIAVTQVCMRHSVGRRYYDTKIAEGTTPQRSDALLETTTPPTTRITSSRNSRGKGLGMMHILPAAPHGTTDQMSPDHAAASFASAGAHDHSEEGGNAPPVDPSGELRCRAGTGATVAQQPEPRPRSVSQQPEPRCQL